jgi:perosamine synthetase
MGTIIRNITQKNLTRIVDMLSILENNWTDIGEEAWKKAQFELDLPGKWDLSFYIERDKKILGYAICSVEGDVGKLHKILVDRHFRGQGLGTKIWQEFLARLRKRNFTKAEFKVHTKNESAINLYRKAGCLFYGKELGRDGRERYLCRYVLKLNKVIRHSRPSLDDSDKSALTATLQSKNIATGDTVATFVSQLSDYIGVRYGVATTNGTSALFLALRALGVDKDSEVILPSFVCLSVLSSVLNCGAKPVLADIGKNSYNISFEDTKRKISKKTKALILPHMFGDPISDIGKFRLLGIPIIEGCAQSLGAVHNGKKVGSFGDISVFSFYATKLMTTGTGGMALTSDRKLYKRLLDLSQYDKRENLSECHNFGMNDLQASLGISQLKRLGDFIKKRIILAGKYNQFLKNSGFEVPNNKESVYYRYILRVPDPASMIRSLRERGVQASRPVFKPLHQYLGLSDKDFPNTTVAYETSLSLPVYPSLSLADLGDVASAVLNCNLEKSYYKGGDSN